MIWLPHLYTATGAVLGFLALVSVSAGDVRQALLWMLAATVVDGTDGWLARRFRVKERLPSFDGARLDDIVDYLNYAVVPAYLVHATALLPAAVDRAIPAAMLLSSAYGFGRHDAKTTDHFFTGFPSYWNVFALYLYLAALPGWINATILLLLCGLVFVRSVYVYPSRTSRLRRLTLALIVVWGATLLWMIWRLPDRSPRLLSATLLVPAYYTLLSVALDRRRRARRGAPPGA